MLLKAVGADGGYEVYFEDDARVCYAYLLSNSEIVGDVWLYNNGLTPTEPEWDEGPQLAPFKNPFPYAKDEAPIRPSTERDVTFQWHYNSSDQLYRVDIYVCGELLGMLAPGATPGWSRYADVTGPLAQVMSE